jgi:hypothetical protein
MIEKGTYLAKSWSQVQFGKNANNKPFVRVKFEVKDHGSIIWDGFLTDEAAEKTLEQLENCGWNGKKLDSKLEGMGTKQVELVIDHEEHDGKTYARVKWVNRPGGNVKNEFSGGDFAQLQSRLAGVMAKRNSKREMEQPAREPEPDFDADDIDDPHF